MSIQTSNYSGERRRGERNGRGCPLLSRLEGLGERVSLSSSNGSGAEAARAPAANDWGVSCAILFEFTHLLLHLTAAWKWAILVGVGDGGRGTCPFPQKFREIVFGRYYVKFGHFSVKCHKKFLHFDNFSYIIFWQKCFSPMTEHLHLWKFLLPFIG